MSKTKDEIDVTNLIQTKAERSCSIAVMDTIGGWHEDEERLEGDERHEGSQEEEDLPHAFGSIQQLLHALVKGTWKPSETGKLNHLRHCVDHDWFCEYSQVTHANEILHELDSDDKVQFIAQW